MSQIPNGTLPYYEAGIYLPMLLSILEKDHELFERGDFKLKKPYLHLIDDTKQRVQQDLIKTKAYFHHNKMRLTRGKSDDLFTEYHFYYADVMECRRYSNIRLRNQSEELLFKYLENHAVH